MTRTEGKNYKHLLLYATVICTFLALVFQWSWYSGSLLLTIQKTQELAPEFNRCLGNPDCSIFSTPATTRNGCIYNRPENVQVDRFQSIGNDSFIYSAYVDRRLNVVRTFGILNSNYSQHPSYCLLWYEDEDLPEVVNGDCTLWDGYDQIRRFSSGTIVCPVNRDISNISSKAPGFVTLSRNHCGTNPCGHFKIVDSAQDALQYKFVVCIHVPLMDNISQYHLLMEHIFVNNYFGAEKFVVYNMSGGVALNPYIEYYIDEGLVELYDWHFPIMHLYMGSIMKAGGQLALIQDFLYRFMYRSSYLVLINLDEFIIPRRHNKWFRMLNASKCRNDAEVLVRNTFFPINIPKTSDDPKLENIFTLSRFTRENHTFVGGARSKVIIKPKEIIMSHVHLAYKGIKPLKHCWMETELGLLHHYRHWGGACEQTKCITDDNLNRFSKKFERKMRKSKKGVSQFLERREKH